MRKLTAVLVLVSTVALVVAAAGCGGGGEDEGASSPAVPFDRAFIDGMVPHHQEAIAQAEAAKAAGLSQPELVEIADAIIATQQEEIDRMVEWREAWYGSREIDPNGAAALGLSDLQMGMQHDAGDLSTAEDVDQAFAAMMIDHHQGAITMASLALDRAEHDEIRELAQGVIDAQQAEIDVMEAHAMGMNHE
jgi:uncharacterized protein (DUF305 family)